MINSYANDTLFEAFNESKVVIDVFKYFVQIMYNLTMSFRETQLKPDQPSVHSSMLIFM